MILTFLSIRKPVVNHHTITEAAKATIMREVLEEHISPNELSRKYSIPAYAIRDWVKKAGHRLPKSYKRFADIFPLTLHSPHKHFPVKETTLDSPGDSVVISGR